MCIDLHVLQKWIHVLQFVIFAINTESYGSFSVVVLQMVRIKLEAWVFIAAFSTIDSKLELMLKMKFNFTGVINAYSL